MGNVPVLTGILKRIGNYDGMDEFNKRLVLQKTIYLLQSFDLYLGYKFSWYIHGPYCTELTRDGYNIPEIDDDTQITVFSSHEDENRFSQFLDFLGENKNNPDWLEIIASIRFLKEINPQMEKEKILDIVVNKQEYFEMNDCINAWEYLKEWGLITE
jgi:uncharacterized protein YwgA